MNPLITRFRELESLYHHGHQDNASWNEAHRELFQLAQAIVSQQAPQLQAELTAARRDVMIYITRHEPPIFNTDHMMAPLKAFRFRWSDIQITPELFLDPYIKGVRVPKPVANKLIKLHRIQVRYVLELIRR